MIIDSSALLAILFKEPEREAFEKHIVAAAGNCRLSPVNYVEAAVRADHHVDEERAKELDLLIGALFIRIEPVTAEQARIAREAYKRFGKGNHPARLNLGDCFAYALAKARSEPLLFKGADFTQTDVEAAL